MTEEDDIILQFEAAEGLLKLGARQSQSPVAERQNRFSAQNHLCPRG
jgi:hypothetical protein